MTQVPQIPKHLVENVKTPVQLAMVMLEEVQTLQQTLDDALERLDEVREILIGQTEKGATDAATAARMLQIIDAEGFNLIGRT